MGLCGSSSNSVSPETLTQRKNAAGPHGAATEVRTAQPASRSPAQLSARARGIALDQFRLLTYDALIAWHDANKISAYANSWFIVALDFLCSQVWCMAYICKSARNVRFLRLFDKPILSDLHGSGCIAAAVIIFLHA